MASLSRKMVAVAIIALQIVTTSAQIRGARVATNSSRMLRPQFKGKCVGRLGQNDFSPIGGADEEIFEDDVPEVARDQCGIHLTGPKYTEFVSQKIVAKRQHWFEQTRIMPNTRNNCKFDASGNLNCNETHQCQGDPKRCYYYRNEVFNFEYDCRARCKGQGGLYQDCCKTCLEAERDPSLIGTNGMINGNKVDSVKCLHCTDAEIESVLAKEPNCRIKEDGSWNCLRSGTCSTYNDRDNVQTGLSQSTKDIECQIVDCGAGECKDPLLKATCCGVCLGLASGNAPDKKTRYACLGCGLDTLPTSVLPTVVGGKKAPRWLVGVTSLAAMLGIAMLLCWCCGHGAQDTNARNKVATTGPGPMNSMYMSVAPPQGSQMRTY